MAWKPSLKTSVDLKTLPLNPLQGFLVSRLDGASDVDALVTLTGQPKERVAGMLNELVAMGAIDPPVGEPAPPAYAVRSPGMPTPPPIAPPAITPVVPLTRTPPPIAPPVLHAVPLAPTPPPIAPVVAPVVVPVLEAEVLPIIEASATTAESDELPPPDDADAEPPAESDEPEPATHRELFETTLHALEADQRLALAHQAVEPQLTALCYDPLGPVAAALVDNPHFGLGHARLLAKHHRTPHGLEALCARAAFTNDGGVRRFLLRNPQFSAALFRRLWQNRRLLEQFQVMNSREVTEMTRRTAREVMRAHFTHATAEERVELIIKTEGRCLPALVTLPIDGKTTALLCSRTYGSTTLVQNLARWSAAPPPLIAHLLRQDLVRRSPMLKTLLERHPNAPKKHV